MDKPDRAEGRQPLPGGLDAAGPASGSRLDLRYAPGRSSRRTEIQVRTRNKVLRCQSQRRPGGLPRARGTRRAPPGGKLETASEPPPEPPGRSKGGAWSAGLAHRPGPKRGSDVPAASRGRCAPACGLAAMCPGRLPGPRPQDVLYQLTACGSAGGAGRCQEAAGLAPEARGPGRKAPGKRKHVEASAAEGRPRGQGQAQAASAWAREARPRCYEPGEAALRRRRAKDAGHPLKRTYGETSVGDRLGPGPAPAGASSQDSDGARLGGPQRRARPRARPPAAPWFPPPLPPPPPPRQKRRRTVLLADAQTQTESAPGSCRCRCEAGGPGPSSSPSPSPSASSSSRPSTSGQARSGRRAGRSSSQSSCREEEEEADGDSGSSSRGSSRTSVGEAGDSGRDSGGASTPSSGSGSDGRRAALEAPGVDSAPGRPGPPWARRRFPATLGGQPRWRRSSSPRALAAAARQPRRSQDNWGCLIF